MTIDEQLNMICRGAVDVINREELAGVAHHYGPIPQAQAWQKQRESQLLYMPRDEQTAETGMLSLKFFEYLAARRPILATGGHPDIVDEKLAETGAGVCGVSDTEVEQALLDYYEEYKRRGRVAFRGYLKAIDRFSQKVMAAGFARLLDDLT